MSTWMGQEIRPLIDPLETLGFWVSSAIKETVLEIANEL